MQNSISSENLLESNACLNWTIKLWASIWSLSSKLVSFYHRYYPLRVQAHASGSFTEILWSIQQFLTYVVDDISEMTVNYVKEFLFRATSSSLSSFFSVERSNLSREPFEVQVSLPEARWLWTTAEIGLGSIIHAVLCSLSDNDSDSDCRGDERVKIIEGFADAATSVFAAYAASVSIRYKTVEFLTIDFAIFDTTSFDVMACTIAASYGSIIRISFSWNDHMVLLRALRSAFLIKVCFDWLKLLRRLQSLSVRKSLSSLRGP